MDYRTNGRLEDYEVFNINKIGKSNIETVRKIYKVKQGGRYRNIVEEEDTIYEVDGDVI